MIFNRSSASRPPPRGLRGVRRGGWPVVSGGGQGVFFFAGLPLFFRFAAVFGRFGRFSGLRGRDVRGGYFVRCVGPLIWCSCLRPAPADGRPSLSGRALRPAKYPRAIRIAAGSGGGFARRSPDARKGGAGGHPRYPTATLLYLTAGPSGAGLPSRA